MPANPEKSATSSAARGRTAASKPLTGSGTTGSASKSRSTTSTRSAGASGSKPPPRTPSASSTVSSKSSISGSATGKASAGHGHGKTSSRGSESEQSSQFKVTKLSSTTVTLSTTWAQPPRASASGPVAAPAPPAVQEQPTRTSDPLQVAAQVYPWTYMSSTLDACFKSAQVAATNDLETRTKELSAEEAEIADQRDRLEAERAIQFYDELGSDVFAKEAPAIMQLFHSHGDSCAKIEMEALELAARGSPDPNDEEPLKAYNDMLDVLENLHTEATSLSNSITKLTEASSSTTEGASGTPAGDAVNATADESSARSQIIIVFAACLPVLRARIANLSMAQELIDSALENVSLGLRMESMGLTD